MNQLETMNELTKLRVILGSFKENLEMYYQMTKVEFDKSVEFFNRGMIARQSCLEKNAELMAISHIKSRLAQIEASTI
jgi:hypothetical protein